MGLLAWCNTMQWKRLSEENEDLNKQVTKLSSMHFDLLNDINQAKRLLVRKARCPSSIPGYYL